MLVNTLLYNLLIVSLIADIVTSPSSLSYLTFSSCSFDGSIDTVFYFSCLFLLILHPMKQNMHSINKLNVNNFILV